MITKEKRQSNRMKIQLSYLQSGPGYILYRAYINGYYYLFIIFVLNIKTARRKYINAVFTTVL